jgi:squalene-hopene/tetraprenyl-beta-curcumene cyclase
MRQQKMKVRSLLPGLLAIVSCTAIAVWIAIRAPHHSSQVSDLSFENWDAQRAASYLDSREVWWQSWPAAQQERGTVCVSCHTVVPYALVRPTLRTALRESGRTAQETAMLTSVEARVNNWATMQPYYTDANDGPGKSAESHATEAVLNAVILASYEPGPGMMSPETKQAFDEAWALQEKTGRDAGGWEWQNFHLAPWESDESAYQGAAMFAIAVGSAPEQYTAQTDAAQHILQLRDYLRQHYATQPVMSQVYVLWASSRMPGLLSEKEKASLIKRLRDLQMRDGGWALTTLDEQPGLRPYLKNEWNLLRGATRSDGCATGLVTVALEQAGLTSQDKLLRQGLEWLDRHQRQDGSWQAFSLNSDRDPNSDIGRFMSDAATGYAVMALTGAQSERNVPHHDEASTTAFHPM